MSLGDWAEGTSFRPLRAITEFNEYGVPTASVFEGELYAPSGGYIKTERFPWNPTDQADALTVAQLANQGVVDILTSEGLQLHVPVAQEPVAAATESP